jgi:phosphatidylserine decarboxylase
MSFRRRAEWLAATASSSPLVSRLTGRLSDLHLPAALLSRAIRAYARLYGADLAEAERPVEDYRSFNDFFTRRLAADRRPIARQAGLVVSPCDARLAAIGPLLGDGRLEQIKGCDYSIEALLGSVEDARPFAEGVQATLYLSPAMYHRVHWPVDGTIRAWRYLPGRLFPVNGFGVRSIAGLYTRNERVAVFMDSAAHGKLAIVLVGAANVGRISLAFADLVTNTLRRPGSFTPDRPIAVCRGAELGAFNLGSTVVLLVADSALAAAALPGALVKVGEPLWREASS